MTRKILCFFGTRPEAIKMAPVVECLRRDKRFRVFVAVSAQHRDMLDQVLDLFQIRCNADLNLMQEGQSLFDVTARVIKSIEPVLEKIKPDLVLVHGDTTTTMAGALASYYKRIPVGHVEAGLRTHDPYRPFPEEMNRRMTDAICTLFFAPTNQSRKNLLRENIADRRVFVTGNTVIDALLSALGKKKPIQSPAVWKILNSLGRSKFILMTAHRRENFGRPFADVCQAVRRLSLRFPDVHWIYPVHPNPNVKGPAHRFLSGRPNLHLVTPVDYSDLVQLIKASTLVVTDSGGLQEEAPSLGKPVLVLRDVTERPEAVKAGTVRIVGTNTNAIIREVSRLLTDKRHYARMANAVNPYGDGRAAERIRQAIRWHFGLQKKRPTTFKGGR